MDPITKLTETFKNFPGIGPKQAKRFVYFLLTKDKNFLENLTGEIKKLKSDIRQCQHCYRFFNNANYRDENHFCRICLDPNREENILLIVEKDIDLESVERAGSFNGRYFVLGGTIPFLDQKPERHIRSQELLAEIKRHLTNGLKEIIIATSATAEGDHTADWLKNFLHNFIKDHNLKISMLGRGLSTGSELEYADSETIKNALTNRG